MSADLSLLVRSNESVSISPVALPIGDGPVSGNPVVLIVGAVGEGNIATGSHSYSASFYMHKVVKPAKRTEAAGTIRRIIDPNDNINATEAGAAPYQDDKTHVDVADTTKTYTAQGSGSDYQVTKVFYADVPAENAAIVGTWANIAGQGALVYSSGFSDGASAEGSQILDFRDGSGETGDGADGMGGNDSGGDGGGGGGGE